MKKFQFRLDAALRLRELQLEAQQAALHRLLAEEQRLKNAIDALGVERREAISFLHESSTMGALELRALSCFLLGVQARVGAYRERLDANDQLIQEQRKRALAAERNVKLLTKLKERRFTEWSREAGREIETIAQDSWLAARHFRREAAEGLKKSGGPAEKSRRDYNTGSY